MLRVGIVAGEASGDRLGAALLGQLRQRRPDLIAEGIGGAGLEAAGCRIIAPMDRLAVTGLLEVAGRYLELLGLRRRILRHFVSAPPDVFIGIDAPDFNLGLERGLRAAGIKTVHYVSPAIWAWRKSRIKKIKQAVDLMMTLFPFEAVHYERENIPVEYVGHPLAADIPLQPDRQAARAALQLSGATPVVALLPGSRENELARLGEPFIRAALLLQQQLGEVRFISSLLTGEARAEFAGQIRQYGQGQLQVTLQRDDMATVLQAADAALLASGTVSLEAMLYKCPMLVAYKANPLTFRLVKALATVKYAALPNILADDGLVEEYLQHDCEPDKLAAGLHRLLSRPEAGDKMRQAFTALHRSLLIGQDDRAANAILKLVADDVG
ncbi:MAG: lipid-A-disaccharide synthase [Gammaproteobacteria bacterium]